jgi:hypothetical protein
MLAFGCLEIIDPAFPFMNLMPGWDSLFIWWNGPPDLDFKLMPEDFR